MQALPSSLRRLIVWLCLALAASSSLALDLPLARLLVNKQASNSDDASRPPYLPIDDAVMPPAGFARIADYTAFALYEGPQATVDALIATLSALGYLATTTLDMDKIQLLGHTVDADTGLAEPPYATATLRPSSPRELKSIYLIALRGYPVEGWLDDLTSRGVVILEPLPPSALLVQTTATVAAGLVEDTPYTRGVFPMLPAMKVEPVVEVASPSDPVYRPISIEAYELGDDQSLEPYLASVSEEGSLTVISRDGAHVQYAAALSEVDISTLSQFDSLIVAAPIPDAAPSSERQCMIVAAPKFGANGIYIETNVEFGGYSNYLKNPIYGKNITDFSNTKVAALDTGFDEGAVNAHPDFTCATGIPNCTIGQSFVTTSLGGTQFNQTNDPNIDDNGHGTVTASVIAGYPPSTAARHDSGSYRYGLGLATTVALAVDRFFSPTGNYKTGNTDVLSRLTNALAVLAPFGPNVVNHSWNAGGDAPQGTPFSNYCAYDTLSQYLDKHTRTANMLHVVAAGNTTDSTVCDNVRSPATAKNAIAVGATENFTLNSSNSSGTGYANTCAFDYFPAVQDARNISSFSARRYPTSLMKPDVVAPGLRVTGPLARTSWETCSPTPCTLKNGIFCNKAVASYSITAPPAFTLRYGMSAGTSFAAPVVTGTAAVLRKWFANQTGNPSANPSPALTKAMIIGGAIDLAGGRVRKVNADGYQSPLVPPPDPFVGYVMDERQGFGLVSLARLLDSFANHFYIDQSTIINASTSYWQATKLIVDSAKKTRVTLVWTDRHSTPAGPTTTTYKIVNDLFLKVCTVTFSTCWWGNVWASGTGNSQAFPNGTFPTQDTLNNVEYVIVPANTFSSGQQVIVQVVKWYLNGDGIDPNGSTARQDFALFGTNVH